MMDDALDDLLDQQQEVIEDILTKAHPLKTLNDIKELIYQVDEEVVRKGLGFNLSPEDLESLDEILEDGDGDAIELAFPIEGSEDDLVLLVTYFKPEGDSQFFIDVELGYSEDE